MRFIFGWPYSTKAWTDANGVKLASCRTWDAPAERNWEPPQPPGTVDNGFAGVPAAQCAGLARSGTDSGGEWKPKEDRASSVGQPALDATDLLDEKDLEGECLRSRS